MCETRAEEQEVSLFYGIEVQLNWYLWFVSFDHFVICKLSSYVEFMDFSVELKSKLFFRLN